MDTLSTTEDEVRRNRRSQPVNWWKCVPPGLIGYAERKKEDLKEAKADRKKLTALFLEAFKKDACE